MPKVFITDRFEPDFLPHGDCLFRFQTHNGYTVMPTLQRADKIIYRSESLRPALHLHSDLKSYDLQGLYGLPVEIDFAEHTFEPGDSLLLVPGDGRPMSLWTHLPDPQPKEKP